MKWAKNLTAVAIVGTLIAVGCGSDSDDQPPAGGAGSGGSSAGAANGGDGSGEAGTPGSTGGNGTGQAGAGGAPVEPGPVECGPFGEICDEDDDCCSKICDMNSLSCAPPEFDECKAAGVACEGGLECCSFHCVNNECSDSACVSDTQACEANEDCCSGKCVGGTCEPLNLECATSGNECAVNDDCCSKLCGDDSKCTRGASFCVQSGDSCTKNEECCSGGCEIADGALLGTCKVPPEGSTFCSGVEGTVCDDCGDCCSRLCAPYGPTGVNVCQPVSGCHSTGELCRSDRDCCGGDVPENPDERLPGWGNGQCQFQPGEAIGICRNPINGEENPDGACSPQGNICHLKDYACSVSSARANCCGGLGAKGGVCQVDPLGVPRCNGLGDTCRMAGETCASADDCCDNPDTGLPFPCVPDDEGTLRCGADPCVEQGGTCTINADCCAPLTCIRPPGSTSGTCGVPEDPPECAAYGQMCTDAGDCCNEVPCTDGICKYSGQ